MTLEQKNRLKEVVEILSQNKDVDSIYLFGSCSRGTEKDDSDIDIVVFLNISKNIESSKLRQYLAKLKRDCMPEYRLVKVDFTFEFNDMTFDKFENSNINLYKEIYRDGIKLYDSKGITKEYLDIVEKSKYI